jgi:hypothetical protein
MDMMKITVAWFHNIEARINIQTNNPDRTHQYFLEPRIDLSASLNDSCDTVTDVRTHHAAPDESVRDWKS